MPLAYTFREGIAGFRRAPFAAFAATSALVVALVLIGVMAFVGYQYTLALDFLRERVGEVEAFLDAMPEAQGRVLTARIAALPGVAHTTFISEAEARRIFMEEFGEDAAAFDDEDFLPASIRVQVAPLYANVDSLRAVKARLENLKGVEEALFDEDLLLRVTQNLRLVSLIGLTLAALVLLAAIFLVANTIRLTVYARRLLIRTMKLVGATDRFIQQPFLVEGLLQGLVAGILAGLMLWGLYAVAPQQFQVIEGQALWFTLAAPVAAGILIGWVGSYFAVRRFVRNVALH